MKTEKEEKLKTTFGETGKSMQQIGCTIMIIVAIVLFIGCANNYRDGVSKYEAGNYEKALEYFNKISKEDKYYDYAQEMIADIDSILKEQRLEQARRDSIAEIVNIQKSIFYELVKKQDQAAKEAMQQYPNDVFKQGDLVSQLDDQYSQEIANKYNISPDSLSSISYKGVLERWPIPDL